MLDVNAFFYQWRIYFDDVYKQTIVTYREQKIFLMSIIKNRNFVIYVSKQMNILLKNPKNFVRIYIDDIICHSKTFEKHLRHFCIFFRIFQRKKIIINLLKTFLKYLSVILFKRRVNVLDLIIAKKKLKSIILLKFSKNLTTLKRYLNLANYVKKYAYFFAEVFNHFKN